MTVWANGEPEIIQYGTNVLNESYDTRRECEERLIVLAKGQDLIQEKAISGIVRKNLVFRAYGDDDRINLEYSCLAVNFKIF